MCTASIPLHVVVWMCVYMCSLTHGGCSTVLLIWTNACAGTTALFSLWERQRGTERETLVLNSADYLNRYIKTWKGAWRIEANIIYIYIYMCVCVCVCVTLSEKTQLKSFFCDLLFFDKKSSFIWYRTFCENFTFISLYWLNIVMPNFEIIVKLIVEIKLWCLFSHD